MATMNAIDTNIPIQVSKGGTGTVSNTQYGVVVGEGVGALQATAAGTTGQLLQSTTASNPTFTSSLVADYAFTSATASVNRVLTVSNTDNTGAATSSANMQITVGGANVGDPNKTHTVTGGGSFTRGIDNSASDAFKLSASTALGTTDTWIMTTAGERTMPLQPMVLALGGATGTDVTGDATVYTLIYPTEILDVGNHYDNSTGIYTAAVTGVYMYNTLVHHLQLTVAGFTSATLILVTSNRSYNLNNYNWCIESSSGSRQSANIFCLADMDIGDTSTITDTISGGTKTVDVSYASCNFNAMLVC